MRDSARNVVISFKRVLDGEEVTVSDFLGFLPSGLLSPSGRFGLG
jgi:hypothetical protein